MITLMEWKEEKNNKVHFQSKNITEKLQIDFVQNPSSFIILFNYFFALKRPGCGLI